MDMAVTSREAEELLSTFDATESGAEAAVVQTLAR